MKGAFLFIAIFALALLIIPMVAISFDTPVASGDAPAVHSPAPGPTQASQPEPAAVTEPEPEATEAGVLDILDDYSGNGVASFRILDQSTGEVLTVSLRDYVRGAVAAEMPVSFHPEALKAQAVAAHTYALYQHRQQQDAPDPTLGGADFSADPTLHQGYISEEEARALYGDKADLYWDKICEAVDSVLDYVLEYEDEPIVAAYHAISAGQTEDAANIWPGEAPYLRSAFSEGDVLAPDFETSVTLSSSVVRDTLLYAYPDAELSEDPEEWFSGITRSDAGYITGIQAGGVPLHGKDLRTIFDLRSHNIDIEYDDDEDRFTFYVYGYGHGVGLSQYGADFMARQGSTFDEILRNYYSDVTLRRIQLPDGV